jgi:hypothetical protein
MKKYLILTFFILFLNSNLISQTVNNDTSKTSKPYYFRLSPIGTSIDIGKYKEKLVQNFEVGKTFGPMDIGLAYGRFSVSDTTTYAQLRTSFNATQVGIFSSELALGVGHVFNSSTPMMFEISTTLMAQVADNIAIGAIFGNFDLVGETNQFTKTFYGLFLRYGLQRNENGGLIGRFGKQTNRRRAKVRR